MRARPFLAAIVVLAAAVSGCTSSSPDVTPQTADARSCAVVIEVAGMRYIGGRQSQSVLPPSEQPPLAARSLECDDSGAGQTTWTPIVATKIRGVPVDDTVAAQGHRLMLSERLWTVAWKDLPTRIQPYVARDRG
jgi:hypothetical protein